MGSERREITDIEHTPPGMVGTYHYDLALGLVFTDQKLDAYFNVGEDGPRQGRPLQIYLPAVVGEDRDALASAIAAARADDPFFQVYWINSHKHGRRRILAVGTWFVDQECRPQALSGYLVDITDLRHQFPADTLVDMLDGAREKANALGLDLVCYVIEVALHEARLAEAGAKPH